jgi:hypothetical protein
LRANHFTDLGNNVFNVIAGRELAGRTLGSNKKLEGVGAKAVREQLVVRAIITVLEWLELMTRLTTYVEDPEQASRPGGISCERHADNVSDCRYSR